MNQATNEIILDFSNTHWFVIPWQNERVLFRIKQGINEQDIFLFDVCVHVFVLLFPNINDHREKWIENPILLGIHMHFDNTAHAHTENKHKNHAVKMCLEIITPPPLRTWNEIQESIVSRGRSTEFECDPIQNEWANEYKQCI